jgi:hypothetical protein
MKFDLKSCLQPKAVNAGSGNLYYEQKVNHLNLNQVLQFLLNLNRHLLIASAPVISKNF